MALNALGLGLLFTAKDLASGVMQNVRNGFAQTRDEVGRFGSRSTEAFKDFGTGIKVMGIGLAGLGAALSTVPAAAEFTGRIAEISTLTEEATLNTGFLSEEVLALNAQYGGGTAAQAKALYDGISAGASNATQAHALLVNSNKLAVAGVTSVSVALDGLTSSLNAYGASFDRAGEFSDAMFVAVRQGKTTVEQLGSVIGRVAPTASAMGVTFDELTASIAAATTKGLKTEEAVTGMKAVLAGIIQPAGSAAAEAQRLGIKFDQAALRSKGFQKFMLDIIQNKKFKADTMSKLFTSVEGLNTALALSANGGAKFVETLEAMKQKTGKTDQALKIMQGTLSYQGKRFTGLAENAKIMVGQALEPIAAAVLRVVNNVMEAFGKVPKPMRDFAVRAFAVASAVTALVGAVVAAKAGISILAVAAKTFGLSAGTGLVSTLLPAVAIIAAVTAAVLAFKYAVDNNLGGIGDRWLAFTDGVSLAWEALTQLFTDGGFSGKVRDEFLKGDNAFVNFALKVWLVVNRVQEFVSALADGFAEVAGNIDFDAFSEALSALSSAFGSLSNDASASGKAFDAFGRAGFWVGEVLGEVAKVVVAVVTAAINVAAGFAAAWGEWVSPALSAAGAAVGEVVEVLGDMVTELADAIGVGGSSGDTFRMLGTVLAVVVGSALKVVASLVRSVASVLRDLAQVFGGVIDVIAGLLSGDWTRAWNGAKRVVYGVLHGVIDILGGVVQAVADVIDALASVTGKDLGLGKGFKQWRESQKDHLASWLGVGPTGAAAGGAQQPETSAAVVGAPRTSASPAVAAAAGPGGGVDAAAVARAAAEGAASRPVQVQAAVAPVYLDGEKVGQVVLRGQQAAAAASYQPLPVGAE